MEEHPCRRGCAPPLRHPCHGSTPLPPRLMGLLSPTWGHPLQTVSLVDPCCTCATAQAKVDSRAAVTPAQMDEGVACVAYHGLGASFAAGTYVQRRGGGVVVVQRWTWAVPETVGSRSSPLPPTAPLPPPPSRPPSPLPSSLSAAVAGGVSGGHAHIRGRGRPRRRRRLCHRPAAARRHSRLPGYPARHP